jgi:hypothetical protein
MESHGEISEAIALDIAEHLRMKPGAADSAEGIRAFWLSPRLRTAPLEHVIAALERLERRGVIEKRAVGVGFIYGIARPATRH